MREDGKVEVNNRHVENLVRKTEKRHFVGKWNSKMFAVCSVYTSKRSLGSREAETKG